MNRMKHHLLVGGVLLTTAATFPCQTNAQSTPLPVATATVAAQPLLAQVRRLEEALTFLGQPLSAETKKLLEQAAKTPEDAAAARLIQQALDPLCLAAVRIPPTGAVVVTDNPARPALIEQGWQTYLVKVVNEAGVTNPLRLHSPSARPVPGGPKEQVKSRWLDIEPFYHRPLQANLSGLGLEYQVVQLYSRDAGRLSATLAFDAGTGTSDGAGSSKPGMSSVRAWNFENSADGWQALNDSTVAVETGNLIVRTRGIDPFIRAPVRMNGGTMRLRIRMTADHDDTMQVFWATEDAPSFDGGRQIAFPIQKTETLREYTVQFPVSGDLSQLRLDFGAGAGLFKIEWLELVCVDGPDTWTKTDFAFNARPSVPVRLTVRDENDKPATAAFLIRDARGRVYPSQSKRLAPDLFFQPQIYRADGETIRLPAGTYTVQCSRGPESVPETRTLMVGGKPTGFAYRVKRWVNPAKQGWWSGDHHIHAAGCLHYANPTEGVLPKDMARHIRGEDLKVGCNLTWGPCFDFQKQFFTGKDDKASGYPYLLRYDIEVSGFGSQQSGHLCLLRLKQQTPPGTVGTKGWPTLGLNTLRWAKRQGAVCGPAHSALGLTNSVGRLPYPDGPKGLPSYALPAFDGIGANEYIMNVTHSVPGPNGKPTPAVDFISAMDTDRQAELNIWYHTLNCGFRTRVSGETDFPCISGDRVGKGRVYVRHTDPLTFDGWVKGVQAGRSYVSDGQYHLMNYRVSAGKQVIPVGEKNSELRLSAPGKVTMRVSAAALDPSRKSVPVEVIVNGYPVAAQQIATEGKERTLVFTVNITRSSWVAVRAFPNAHTNPVFVLVGGKPIRASRRSAAWCLRGVDQCWTQKKPFYAPTELRTAQADYEHARQVYRRILAECETE